MKLVFNGLESSGKSLLLSRQAEKVLRRNKLWYKIRKKKKLEEVKRTMAFNQPMSEKFIRRIYDANCNYLQFRSFDEIEHLTEADIFIDELLKFFPSRGSDPLPFHVMEFLTQGAKSGNNIYATSQDFSQVHKQFRILTNKVYIVRKIVGSPRPIKSMPPVTSIWGLCIKKSVDPQSFQGDMAEMKTKFIPIPFTIQKADTLRYDTLYKVPNATWPDLKLRPQRIYKVDSDGHIIEEKTVHK